MAHGKRLLLVRLKKKKDWVFELREDARRWEILFYLFFF